MPNLRGPLSGLSAIADEYDAILSDVWGVIHNGIAPHPSAVEALIQYRLRGGVVVLITNAPRPSAAIESFLRDLGIGGEAYDGIVSSGDVTRAMLKQYRGKVLHYVGPPEENDQVFEGLGITFSAVEDAEAVVITDPESDDDTLEMYDERIAHWLERRLPLIVANPDRVVEHGDRLVYCGGAVADIYAERGGIVHMAGKPYGPIYDAAVELSQQAAGRALQPSRVLAVGDSVRTDAIGAAGANLDLLFITGSIHAAELDAFGSPDPAAIETLLAPSGAKTIGYMARLAW